MPLPCQCCHPFHVFLLGLVERLREAQRQRGDTHAFNVSAHALKPLPCLAPSTIREFFLPCQRRLLVSSKPSAFALHPFHVFLLGLVERLREAQRQPGDAVVVV